MNALYITQCGICSALATHIIIIGNGELEAGDKAKEAARPIFDIIDMVW